MSVDFFQTMMGRKFYEGDIPRLVGALERIAGALEKANSLKEQELKAGEIPTPAQLAAEFVKHKDPLGDWMDEYVRSAGNQRVLREIVSGLREGRESGETDEAIDDEMSVFVQSYTNIEMDSKAYRELIQLVTKLVKG